MALLTHYIASYPRSGNTLLRLILFHRFGIRTGSIYGDDVYFLDIYDPDSMYMKTHERYKPVMQGRHIYIERDAETNKESIKHYLGPNWVPKPKWGTQQEHIASWKPSGALWLHFEKLKSHDTLDKLEAFTGLSVIPGSKLPDFKELQATNKKFFRKGY